MSASQLTQSCCTLLLIRPAHFGFNSQTSDSNIFQKKNSGHENETNDKAIEQFNHFVSLLHKYAIDVVVIDDQKEHVTPDSVFPNNWFSTHHDGTVILYPMLAQNRRLEKRKDIFEILKTKFGFSISRVIDLSRYENENKFLEGTGSLVFDHKNKIAYANLSSRTNKEVTEYVCRMLNYEPVIFTAKSKIGKEIYHTNVLLTITENFAVICSESIKDKNERNEAIIKLSSSGHEIIEITFEQMEKFVGNMLQVKNQKGDLISIMSQTAFDCLDERQLEIILTYSQILPVSIPIIETVGGGSVRCMMAEIFLEKV